MRLGVVVGATAVGWLGRGEMSDALLAVGSGPQVAAVGLSLQRPFAFVDEPMMEGAQPGGVVENAGSAVAAEDDVVQLGDVVAAVGEGALAAVAVVGGAALG